MMRHVQIPPQQGKEKIFIEKKRKFSVLLTKSPSVFIGWVLARKEFFFMLGSAFISGCESSPFWLLVCCAQLLSRVGLCDPTHCAARHAPLSMEFSRQESQSRLPFPPPGDFPNPETDPKSLRNGTCTSRISHNESKYFYFHRDCMWKVLSYFMALVKKN